MTNENKKTVIGIPTETFPTETRVALTPATGAEMVKAGLEVVMQKGAGTAAGFQDFEYEEKGVRLVEDRKQVFELADVILQVRSPGANRDAGSEDIELARPDQVLIGLSEPFDSPDEIRRLAEGNITTLSMELIPRITRAQSMDSLSSMATLAGYKAVLLAADALPKIFPMLMTAAGTIAPARVFVIGAGVAGLQAISAARRLGAVVTGYDVRVAVKEQVESLGARFLELEIDSSDAEGQGGYAKAMDESYYQKQREMMARTLAEVDVVITTAAVPGKTAPTLITREMVAGMKPGSVIVDLAAERGGNCELTIPGEEVTEGGVKILGPLNLPATLPHHASQMYAKNVWNLLSHLIEEGELDLDRDDEIIQGTLVTRKGEVLHPMVLERLNQQTTTANN